MWRHLNGRWWCKSELVPPFIWEAKDGEGIIVWEMDGSFPPVPAAGQYTRTGLTLTQLIARLNTGTEADTMARIERLLARLVAEIGAPHGR